MLSLVRKARKDGDTVPKVCCFTGNREMHAIKPSELYQKLRVTLIDLIENKGFTDFRAGGARGFDTVAALCVLELKAIYPQVKLHLYLPCKNQERYYNSIERKFYYATLDKADTSRYIQANYSNTAMFARNRALVDGSDVCVAFSSKSSGGTYYTVNYANQKNVPVIHLFDRKTGRLI